MRIYISENAVFMFGHSLLKLGIIRKDDPFFLFLKNKNNINIK